MAPAVAEMWSTRRDWRPGGKPLQRVIQAARPATLAAPLGHGRAAAEDRALQRPPGARWSWPSARPPRGRSAAGAGPPRPRPPTGRAARAARPAWWPTRGPGPRRVGPSPRALAGAGRADREHADRRGAGPARAPAAPRGAGRGAPPRWPPGQSAAADRGGRAWNPTRTRGHPRPCTAPRAWRGGLSPRGCRQAPAAAPGLTGAAGC